MLFVWRGDELLFRHSVTVLGYGMGEGGFVGCTSSCEVLYGDVGVLSRLLSLRREVGDLLRFDSLLALLEFYRFLLHSNSVSFYLRRDGVSVNAWGVGGLELFWQVIPLSGLVPVFLRVGRSVFAALYSIDRDEYRFLRGMVDNGGGVSFVYLPGVVYDALGIVFDCVVGDCGYFRVERVGVRGTVIEWGDGVVAVIPTHLLYSGLVRSDSDTALLSRMLESAGFRIVKRDLDDVNVEFAVDGVEELVAGMLDGVSDGFRRLVRDNSYFVFNAWLENGSRRPVPHISVEAVIEYTRDPVVARALQSTIVLTGTVNLGVIEPDRVEEILLSRDPRRELAREVAERMRAWIRDRELARENTEDAHAMIHAGD